MMDIIYGEERLSLYRVFAKERPAIPAPEYDYEEEIVPGRDGALHIDNKRWKPLEIPITFNYIGKPEDWYRTWRTVKRILLRPQKQLILSEDPDCYYCASYVKLSENSRTSLRTGEFTATFVCDPFTYLREGDRFRSYEFLVPRVVERNKKVLSVQSGRQVITGYRMFLIENIHERTRPVYRIKGNGNFYLNVNRNPFCVRNIQGGILIHSGKETAQDLEGRNRSTMATGDYGGLELISGENEIFISSGFEIEIAPMWREL